MGREPATFPVCPSFLSYNRHWGQKQNGDPGRGNLGWQVPAQPAPGSSSLCLNKGAWQNGFFISHRLNQRHTAAASRALVLFSIPAAPDGLRTKPGGCPEYSLFSAHVSFFTTHGERAIRSICLVLYFLMQWPQKEAALLLWKIPGCERCGCWEPLASMSQTSWHLSH